MIKAFHEQCFNGVNKEVEISGEEAINFDEEEQDFQSK